MYMYKLYPPPPLPLLQNLEFIYLNLPPSIKLISLNEIVKTLYYSLYINCP